MCNYRSEHANFTRYVGQFRLIIIRKLLRLFLLMYFFFFGRALIDHLIDYVIKNTYYTTIAGRAL